MSNLNNEQLSLLKELLDKRYDDLRQDLRRELNDQDSYLELWNEVPDPGDSSFANLAVDLGNAAMTRDVAEMRAIDRARKRMESGAYGSCVNCEGEIPFERLKLQPTAERCAACQDVYEKTHGETTRGPTL